jgi:hypothetical protein
MSAQSPPLQNPIYTSAAPDKSIGKSYSVFPDRVELALKIIGETISIPAGDLVSATLVPGGIREILLGTLKGRYPIMSLVWALTFDIGVFKRHILLRTKAGLVRYFRFTPHEPERFVAACNSILTADEDSRFQGPVS